MQNNPLSLRIALAQLNPCVGDIAGNFQLAKQAIQTAQTEQADVIVFPECMLSGYAPEDLVYRHDFLAQLDHSLQQLARIAPDLAVVIGTPLLRNEQIINAACVLQGGEIQAEYAKQRLPNYRVFDEKRWFTAGKESLVIDIKGIKTGILVCEDIWRVEPMKAVCAAGAEIVLSLNASPYRMGKAAERHELLHSRASEYQCPIAYVNLVGGQDELVFDGGSLLTNQQGDLVYQLPNFEEQVAIVDWQIKEQGEALTLEPESVEAEVYQALVLSVRDYVHKSGFQKVLLGLSGGIDSALTLAIAVDALGAENVQAVMMPFHYTADISREDAQAQADMLGIDRFLELPIANAFDVLEQTLQPAFQGKPRDVTEENMQARIRGLLLMSMSNKLGSLLLVTSNKSESAVGYATLYGDMAGAYAPLKDVYKTLVYRLANYRNTLSSAIPQRVIDRPPSAELAPDQVDQDSLPPYDILDDILHRFIEQDQSLETIVAAGFDQATVRRVVNLVLLNEYKRRQAAVGTRITGRAFGRDWRYPIASAWRKNLPLSNEESV